MPRAAFSLAVYFVPLSLWSGTLRAGEAAPEPLPPPASLWAQTYATGDWGGWRKSLDDHGVVFNFTYAADTFGAVSGGIKRGVFFNGLLDLGTDIDLEKLAGWKGTHFHINGIYPHGENGSANYVGDLGAISSLEAYDTIRLYELWVEQDLFEDRFSLRVGQITFDSEFAVLDAYGGLFIHSGFGTPTALSLNLPIPIYPNAAPGIRVRIQPATGFAIQAAVFDGNPAPGLTLDPSPDAALSNELNRHGTHWALRSDEGALFVTELSYRFNQVPHEEASATRTTADSRPMCPVPGARTKKRGLAGSYELGFVYHTDDFADIYDVTLARLGSSLARSKARDRGANFAIYINFEQEVWREAETENQGLGLFAHAIWMPPDRNFCEFSIEGGLHYRGLFPNRDDDAIGLGITYLKLSDRVTDATHDANTRDGTSLYRPDFETTIELVYRCQIAPWCSLQPHAQYVIHPGATGEHDNALIFGVRTNLVF